jgi:alkanesulfonate monooxygenase SsuD/methylene tetrahydromethanopterin reductase-like flavin-dependent oxidoreductase (luciferase family)
MNVLPRFNASMVLPPFTGDEPTAPATMSPYRAQMLEFTQQFATSQPRATILEGLIHYREALRSAGIVDAFQWMDGSFVEDAEQSRGRPPGDIDVVTFGSRPQFADAAAFHAWIAAHAELFKPREAKRLYSCDAYFVDLGKRPDLLVDDTRYWFGLFSHQRETALWKGMVQIPLLSDDDQALVYLQNLVFDEQGDDDA